jgi:hypothetical protein
MAEARAQTMDQVRAQANVATRAGDLVRRGYH